MTEDQRKAEQRAARLAFLQAQTRNAHAQASMLEHELAHKEAGDYARIYHFPTIVMPETIDTCIEVLQHWMAIDPEKPMTVALNSPGGAVFPGFALYDFIVDHVEQGYPIDTTSYGECASMASVILQAGRVRSLHRNAFLMIHEVQSFVKGTLQGLKDQIEFTENLQTRIESILVSRANPDKITQPQLHEHTKHFDWWMFPEEALENGFIDVIAN